MNARFVISIVGYKAKGFSRHLLARLGKYIIILLMVNGYIIANDIVRIRTSTWIVHWYIQSAANRIFFSTQKICILPFVVCCPLTCYILGKVNFTRLDFAFFCMAPLKYTCVEFYKGYSINLSFISICYLILKLSLSMQINKLHIRLTYITIKETLYVFR